MRSWSVGAVTITQIVEQVLPQGIPGLLPDATPQALLDIEWLHPEFVTAEGDASLSLHALVVDTPDKRILVDTCIGNDKQIEIVPIWNELHTDFLDKMIAAGFGPETIDIVVCTHLHLDHVGWNTRKTESGWVATFPNARYLIARQEYEAMLAVETSFEADEDWRKCVVDVNRESIAPVVKAGMVDFVEMDHVITPEVWLRPTVGHSAGHVSVVIESGSDKAIITGDAVHHPCQLAHPEWAASVDADQKGGIETRRSMLGEAADSRRLMLGTHWTGIGGGFLLREKDTFRLDMDASYSAVASGHEDPL